MGDITLYWYTSMPVVSCFMWNGALGSSGVLLSYSIISLASPMTCQYTDIYPLLNIHIYTSPLQAEMRRELALAPTETEQNLWSFLLANSGGSYPACTELPYWVDAGCIDSCDWK